MKQAVQEKQTPQHRRKSGLREKNIREEGAALARSARADGTFQKGSVKTFSRKTGKCILVHISTERHVGMVHAKRIVESIREELL
jgi:hypothetical protein